MLHYKEQLDTRLPPDCRMGREPIRKKGIGKMNRISTNRHGFTLIEIVIAVAIVAIFAAALSPMVFRHLEDAKLANLNLHNIDECLLICFQIRHQINHCL